MHPLNTRKSLLKNLFANSSAQGKSRRKRLSALLSSASIEELESRKLLASFQYSSGQLTIITDTDNEILSIFATTGIGNYTIQTSGTFSGDDIPGQLEGNTTDTLTVNNNLSLSNINFSDNPANTGSGFYFGNSTGNFITNLSVNYQNETSGSILIANDTLFTNSANLSLATVGNSITQYNMVSANGAGSIAFTARNIDIWANITTESGGITLDADNGLQQTGDFQGVSIQFGFISTTGGNILIHGRNGDGAVFGTGVYISSSTISTLANGSISIFGNTSNNALTSQTGIDLDSSAISTENGNVSLTGKSAGISSTDIGVYARGVSVSILITGNGSIAIDGLSGNGNGTFESGVLLSALTASTFSGNISIKGVSQGIDDSSYGYGVQILSGTISIVDSGNIIIDGAGGTGNGGRELGVGIDSSRLEVNNGSISISGRSYGMGTGSDNYGIGVSSTSVITVTGTGNILLNGTSGNGTGGNEVGVFVDSSQVTNANGSITITGSSNGLSDTDSGVQLIYTATSNPEITVYSADQIRITGISSNSSALNVNLSNATVSSNGGQIWLTGNSVKIDTDTQVNATTSGTVTFETLGTGIVLGDENSPSDLGLPQLSIDRITAGTLALGNANATDILVNAPISWSSNLSLATTGKYHSIIRR
jgi:hypothetical protein